MIRRNRVFQNHLFFLVLCMLAWNLGFSIYPASTFQNQPTSTLESSQTLEVLETETPEPAALYTDTPAPTDVVSDSAFTQTSEPVNPDVEHSSLPAVFAPGTFVQGELVVRFKPSTSRSRIEACFQEIDAQVQDEIEGLNTFILADESGELANTFYQVLNCAGALYVEPNFLLHAADTVPNDPNWGVQYGLTNIRAPQGWDLATGSSAVTIAIVDSGVDLGHPDLAGKLVAGYDFVNNDANPQDDYGHGTHVAGIAAAITNNGSGIAGVSWGARIMPVKVLNSAGGGTFAGTAAGIVWAVDHGAQVINLSLGGSSASSILEDAINYAYARGAIVIAAAGNTGSSFVLYPARYPNVIAVAKTNSANTWDGSNFGPEIDLSAPGAVIYSTVVGGYNYMSGSSMSTGFVSGLAAVLMSVPGNSAASVIEYQMESTALDVEFAGWDEYTGAGLIQMDSALQLALQSVPTATNSQPAESSNGAGPGPVWFAETQSPTATWTASPPLPLPQTTATFTIENTATPGAATTPAGSSAEEEREVEAQQSPEADRFILPCTAILFILLGLILVWIFRKKQREL